MVKREGEAATSPSPPPKSQGVADMAEEPDTIIEEIKSKMTAGREDLAMAYALGAINSIAEFSRTPAEHTIALERIQEIFRIVFPPVLVA